MEIREGSSPELSSQKGLSDADIEVLILAIETKSVVLMDDLAARRYAQSLGLAVVGTLGVIEIAARRGLISLRDSFDRLQQTNIRITESLYQQILERNSDLA
jgi:predicted nucleic acid-binding protein